MTTNPNTANLPAPNSGAAGEIMERVFVSGDLSRLTPEERTRYYMQTCESLGLNPLTKPFDYVTLNGKMQLYALKACTDQLRGNRGLSVSVKDRVINNDILTVAVEVTDHSGRRDEDYGAVSIKGLAGDALANATMKALTKAKRRATLSFCGLGMLDEAELETIPPHARDVTPPAKRMTADPLAHAAGALPPPVHEDRSQEQTRAAFEVVTGDGEIVQYEKLSDYVTGLENEFSKCGDDKDRAGFWESNSEFFNIVHSKYVQAGTNKTAINRLGEVSRKITDALAGRAA